MSVHLGFFHFGMRLAEMIHIQVPGIVLTNISVSSLSSPICLTGTLNQGYGEDRRDLEW